MTNPELARRFSITVRGKTEDAYEDALAEAMRLISEGCVSGSDSNDTSGFYFSSTDNLAPCELPA